MRRLLRPLRRTLGLACLAALTAAFVDFRGLVPAQLSHWLAAIQFAPALRSAGAGLAAATVLLLIVGATLAFGRVYCSTLCPLGLLQDVMARLAAWVRPRPRPLRFVPGNRWVRYGVLAAVVVGIAGGAGAVVFTWTDPYSHFGRIATGLFRPLLVAANNGLVPASQHFDASWLYRVPFRWPAPAVALPALTLLVLLAVLVAWRERIFCNTLCPVGTMLGLFARHAAFQITLAPEACTKCAACLKACKAQCIDLRRGRVDASRCVGCFNCIAACPEQGLAYACVWTLPAVAPDPDTCPSAPVADPTRRALLAGLAAMAVTPVLAAGEPRRRRGNPAPDESPRGPAVPPGAGSTRHFLSRCTACQLCVSACPTQVLQPAGLEHGFAALAKPLLDFEHAFCNYDCHRCGEVCPTGAIAPLSTAEKRLTSVGVARFEPSRCVVETNGTDCAACSEHCPTKAVFTEPHRNNLRLPRVDEELCIGCGACEYACPVRPVRAITVSPRAVHTRAKPPTDAVPATPPVKGDFPF
ncbi:MAG TPA: 4Fe-4S binding protein [Lacunisphaera sp.]|nr:4Fe-4S binding protein [Lacunisphaera sp.]